MCKIYIIQHCQSEHHINELTGGWTDTPLTELGINQSKAVAEEIENLGLSDFVLYSSDLKRAFMTAEYISERFGIKITDTELLREINNGEAANKTMNGPVKTNYSTQMLFKLINHYGMVRKHQENYIKEWNLLLNASL